MSIYFGRDGEIRTLDLTLPKRAFYQLNYVPCTALLYQTRYNNDTMALTDIFASKKLIDTYLTNTLTQKQSSLSSINTWGTESITRLLPYIVAGKSVRGCLSLFSYRILSASNANDALPMAAGLELIHTGALIHDDIMDQDDMRRHLKAMHKQFETFSQDTHFGESMAINIGDLCFFLAFEEFAKIVHPNLSRIISLAAQDFSGVTIGQQFDVASSYTNHESTESEILSLYTHKTARYTFSLPLMMGGLLSGTDDATLNTLESLGQDTGILFQIRDDELSIIGNPEKTGKPIASDQMNKKQTLIQHYLKKENATDYTTSMAYTEIQTIKTRHADSAIKAIHTLAIDEGYKQTLIDLVSFCGSREA